MKISTAELKKFKSKSSFLKQNNTLPILGYLRFQDGKVTKSNLHSFVTQNIGYTDNILIDELMLFNFINGTSEPMIDITTKDKRVFLSDGKSKVSFPYQDFQHFPATPYANEEGSIEVSNEVFCAINCAAGYVLNMDLPDIRSYVFVGDKHVGGCNGTIGYVENFKEDVPKFVLLKEVAMVVGKFDTAVFSESESFVFFDMDDCQYGFVKPQIAFTDLSTALKRSEAVKSFSLLRNEILAFTDMCLSSTKVKWLSANISMKGSQLKMSMQDVAFDIDISKTVEVEGEMEGDFDFNIEQMNLLLRSLPDNELTFRRGVNQYQITGETGFLSIIQQVTKN